MRHACQQTFALRLKPLPTGELVGEIEHVLSGERRPFDSGAALLRALQALQRLQDAPAGTAPG
jgi:hypothetical protein